MGPGFSILTIIGVAILVFTIWNLIILRRLKKQSNQVKPLDDAKYFELKAKNDFLFAIATVVATAIAVLGYNSIQDVEKSLKQDYSQKVDSLNGKMNDISRRSDSVLASININSNDIEKRLNSNKNDVNNNKELLESIRNKQIDLKNLSDLSAKQMDTLARKIVALNSKNILKLNYYIVDTLIYNLDSSKGAPDLFVTYHFKDLKTNMGDKLPDFDKPPFIVPISFEGTQIHIKDVTKDFFKAAIFEWLAPEQKLARIELLIFEVK